MALDALTQRRAGWRDSCDAPAWLAVATATASERQSAEEPQQRSTSFNPDVWIPSLALVETQHDT
jgi:hypothetical protein